MSDFSESVMKFAGGWQQIHFPNCGTVIPNIIMIKDLLIPRSPDYVIDLLKIYRVSKDTRRAIENLPIEQLEEKEIWRRIMLICEIFAREDSNYRSIHKFVSQNYYSTSSLSEYRLDHHSVQSVIEYSSYVVESLKVFADKPSEDIVSMKYFCEQNGLDFEVYQYNFLVKTYCYSMLPYPYKTRGNIDTLERETASHLAMSSKRTGERFPCFLTASIICNQFLDAFSNGDKEIQKNFDFERSMSIGNDVSATRKKNRELRNSELPQHLHQCPFCFKISIRVPPKQGRSFPQHCGQPECKKSHKAWRSYLKRLGLSSKA